MTIPTKEEALAALKAIKISIGGVKHTQQIHQWETLRTYINGEKDSLGADVPGIDKVRDVICAAGHDVFNGRIHHLTESDVKEALAILDQQDAPNPIMVERRKTGGLSILNEGKTISPLADLRAKVKKLYASFAYIDSDNGNDIYYSGYNAALDAVIALIDGEE